MAGRIGLVKLVAGALAASTREIGPRRSLAIVDAGVALDGLLLHALQDGAGDTSFAEMFQLRGSGAKFPGMTPAITYGTPGFPE